MFREPRHGHIPELKKPAELQEGNHRPYDGDLTRGFNTGQSPLDMLHPDHEPRRFGRGKVRMP